MKAFFYLTFVLHFTLNCGSETLTTIANEDTIESKFSQSTEQVLDQESESEEVAHGDDEQQTPPNNDNDQEPSSNNNDQDQNIDDNGRETDISSKTTSENSDITEENTQENTEGEAEEETSEPQVQELQLLAQGQGDCDNSLECADNLVCINPNGQREEKNSNEHGFSFVIENQVTQPGNETCQLPDLFTEDTVFLLEGQGDCDNSLECANNLVCLNPNGEREEQDSNEHGFTFVMENDISQPGNETCQPPVESETTVDDNDIKFAANTLVVKNNDQWYFVYCSGNEVKLSQDSDKMQTWEKQGTRNIGIPGGSYLHCPEKGTVQGTAPTTCECNDQIENYHEKRKAEASHFEDNVTGPASITTNEEIYIGPNNNMNACLKVVKDKASGELQIHSPCALEPWKTNQKCKQEGDYTFLMDNYEDPSGSSKTVHELDCNEFRLNN